MRQDYQLDHNVRLLRRIGRAVCWLIAVGLILGLGLKIAQVSETRAMDATREQLAASLNSLVAEHVAQGRVLDPAWSKTNPFVLLRWQQGNYCGELAVGGKPKSGCWYWLPSQVWVLYQARFGDGWTLGQGELHAYRLLVLPSGVLAGSHLLQPVSALELEAVPAAEIFAQGWLSY
jgi:hypothetical protein